MNVEYVIPSYSRANLLCETTLKLLDKHKIKEVTVIVSEFQEQTYKDELEKHRFNIKVNLFPTELEGIGNIRNLIRDMYSEGTNVLMVDDDIKQVCIKNDETNKLIEMENINEFVEKMFKKCVEEDIYYWGVHLHNNPFFMKKDFVRGLNYINGSFTGVRIEHSKKKIRTNINHFEDYLFSILHYIRDKNVLKAANVCLKTKCFNTSGGICNQLGGLNNRKGEAVQNGDLLESHFGDLLYLKHSKKYDIINIQLKKMKWRESYLDLWDNYNKHTNPIEKKDIEFDNLEKELENWDHDEEEVIYDFLEQGIEV